jgi:hypothetical protein
MLYLARGHVKSRPAAVPLLGGQMLAAELAGALAKTALTVRAGSDCGL